MKRIVLSIVTITLAMSIFAQSDINENVERVIKMRVEEKARQLTDYINFIADPVNNYKERTYYKEKALNLFIGKGDSYELDGVYNKGVIMQVTSVYRSKPSIRLMRDYFSGLLNMRYSRVDVSATEFGFKVSNLKQTDDDTYVCTCVFEQEFCGWRDGIPVYRDITRKEIKCHIIKELVEGEDGDIMAEFIVLLGDVTALETRRIR